MEPLQADKMRAGVSLQSGHHRFSQAVVPYLLVAPAVLLILGLVFYPLGFSVWSSFHVDDLLYQGLHTFVGFRNYQQVLSDPAFQLALRNTVVYYLLASLGVVIFGLTIAHWLNQLRVRWRAFFLTVVLLPWAVPGVVTGLLWSFIYNPTSGLLNGVLKSVGLIRHDVVWFDHPGLALVLIAVALLWQIVPLSAIILLAGIRSIPPTLYEAARVDGAHSIAAFWRITVPLLRPALAIVMVQTAVSSIGIFDQVYVLTGYDPSTKSAIIQTYLYAFQNLNFGQGISAALLATLAITLVGYLYLRVVYREVTYS